MDHCLRISELIRSICDNLDKATSLSVALTCKAFLEPGLDKVWRNIASLEPLACCLPAEIWKDDRELLLSLRTTLTYDHLRRYLDIYAHRIHSMSPNHWVKQRRGLSIESLQALQLATDFKLGALSPQLRRFGWDFMDNLKGHPAGTLNSYVSLFIGGQVEELSLGDYRDDPIYLGSVISTTRRLPHLRKLSLCGQVTSFDFTTRYITRFPWEYLEEVHFDHISRDIVVHLARLPRLRYFRFFEEIDTSPPLRETVPADPAGQHDFASLRVVDVMCWNFDMIKPLLQAVTPSNKLERVSTSCPCPTGFSECQGSISAIRDHCNPHTLRSIEVEDTRSHGWEPEEKLDMYPDPTEEDIDISGLSKFVSLRRLVVRWEKSIQLTPREIALIPTWWPNIRHLDLCQLYPSQGRIPAIDHNHVLDLARGLPKLRFLGVRFDTTQIPPQYRGPMKPSDWRF